MPESLPSPQLPSSEIERLLCAPQAAGSLEALLPRSAEAWGLRFPSLASFAAFPDGAQTPRICIATEQISGPVRNGGIGTTYAALANLLGEAGFDVTVLFLRGRQVEVETIEHWIDYYAQRNVKLVPVPDYATAENFRSGSERWLNGPYNMMRYLIDHPMDVVHVSEWRGSAYLSLLAKRQGIAFADTLFAVKTSSPWMWNRLYGGHAIEKAEDLIKIRAERLSVELADVVIGGSTHLLRWMASQGYAVPQGRSFVQPNVVTFTALEPLMKSRALPGGERTPIDEIVFFGRLEARKGLFVFCQAIRRLIRKGVAVPKITFMGKPGARLPSHPDHDVPDYIREVSENWPCEVQILPNFQQPEAIAYLLGGKRLAVMPSIIENSSMAVYEAAICGIPCVATDVGGNAELIEPADHAAVLCQPHPVSLGDKLEEALALGGMVPRPSFDNTVNLATWVRFHRQLGGPLREELLAATRPAPLKRTKAKSAPVAVCIYYTGDDAALGQTLESLAALCPVAREILIGIDAEHGDAAARVRAQVAAHGLRAELVDAYDLDAGAAFNAMARHAQAERLLFLWEGASLIPSALASLQGVAASGAQVLTWLHRVEGGESEPGESPELRAVIVGGASDGFFRNDTAELPLFVARESFLELGGFTEDYRALGYDHEFVAKAQMAGLSCQTAMLELGSIIERSSEWMRVRAYDLSASGFRAIRPKLAASPLGIRDLLLFSRGMHLKGAGAGKGKLGEGVQSAESVLVRMMASLAREEKAGEGRKPRETLPRVRAAKLPDEDGSQRPTPTRSLLDLVESFEPARKAAPKEKPAAKGATAKGNAKGANAKAKPAGKLVLSPALRVLLDEGQVAREGKLVGQVLGLIEGRLYGWAQSLGGARRALDVELTLDGRAITHRARHHFSPFADLPPEAAGHGFVIDLPISAERLKNGIAYAVRVAGTELVLGEGLAMGQAASIARCGIEAQWEPSEHGLLRGWAWHPEAPARAVDLAAFVDGEFLARIRADRPRAGSEARGFEFALPALLQAGGRHRIDLVVAQLGVPLRQSPGWFEGARVDVGKKRVLGIF